MNLFRESPQLPHELNGVRGRVVYGIAGSSTGTQERGASADLWRQVYHSLRENLVTDSWRLQSSTENPVALWGTLNGRKIPPRFLRKRDIRFSQRPTLKCCSKIAKIWESWSRHSWTSSSRSREENQLNYTKNCLYEEEHYENFVLEEFNRQKNLRIFRKRKFDELYTELEINSWEDLTAQISEWKRRLFFLKNSREFQELKMQLEITTRCQFIGNNFIPLSYAEPWTQLTTEELIEVYWDRFFDNSFASAVHSFLGKKCYVRYLRAIEQTNTSPLWFERYSVEILTAQYSQRHARRNP